MRERLCVWANRNAYTLRLDLRMKSIRFGLNFLLNELTFFLSQASAEFILNSLAFLTLVSFSERTMESR